MKCSMSDGKCLLKDRNCTNVSFKPINPEIISFIGPFKHAKTQVHCCAYLEVGVG